MDKKQFKIIMKDALFTTLMILARFSEENTRNTMKNTT